jgi:hypothetical protein
MNVDAQKTLKSWKDGPMKKNRTLNRRLVISSWGVALILVGVLSLIPGGQDSLAVLGIGVILLALNLARFINGIDMSLLSLIIGASMFILGAWSLVRAYLGYPVALEIQLLPVLLISVGIYLLIPCQNRPKTA